MTMKTERLVSFKKLDEDRQLAFGEVYIPMVPDSQGDFMSAESIEKMAHNFMKKGIVNNIDTQHNLVANGSVVVESFIARKGDPDFIEGSWVLGVWVPDDLWPAVKSGELGGFSMYGQGYRTEKILQLDIPDSGIIKGDTARADGHTHKYIIQFSEDGEFLGGKTDHVNGHSHEIIRGTKTEKGGDNDHVHRFSFLEVLVDAS